MPAWMTSLLRELVPEPISVSCSRISTSRPLRASARAMASPTTPAPITTHSISSIDRSRHLFGRRQEPAQIRERGDMVVAVAEHHVNHRKTPQAPADAMLIGDADAAMEL